MYTIEAATLNYVDVKILSKHNRIQKTLKILPLDGVITKYVPT